MIHRLKTLLFVVLGTIFIAFLVMMAFTVSSYSNVSKTIPTQSIKLQLPSDVDKTQDMDATNTDNGVCVSYYSVEGKFKMVQYSGVDYKQQFVFEFE